MTKNDCEHTFYRTECSRCGSWYPQKYAQCPSCKHSNEDYKLHEVALRGRKVDKPVDKVKKKGDN